MHHEKLIDFMRNLCGKMKFARSCKSLRLIALLREIAMYYFFEVKINCLTLNVLCTFTDEIDVFCTFIAIKTIYILMVLKFKKPWSCAVFALT